MVQLEDRGQISVDWIECPNVEKVFNEKTPIVVFLPGLTGDRHCGYSKALIREIARRKFKPVILNHRGCARTPLTTPKFYSADTIGDARAGFGHIHRTHPQNPVYAIGVSLGATILGNFVAAEGEACKLKGVVAMCAGFDLFSCTKNVERNLFGIYNMGLGINLRRKLREHEDALKPLENILKINLKEEIPKVKGMRDFDQLITAPTLGYGFPDNYYRVASLGPRLKDIKVPTLLFSPTDDPIPPYVSIELVAAIYLSLIHISEPTRPY
eukprot:TRINITY_DN1727_c0_g1_i16.p1 TRINITY_DN1727_c0_g1~~TRINITY_DN1727_c0_g1_i16.p1  ORF type:complete len:269 (-),score=76.14 TRINITY_DN1727_c0_g1_i16:48-854(-)